MRSPACEIRRQTVRLVLSCLVLVAGLPASMVAQPAPAGPSADWQARLKHIGNQLVGAEWQPAEREAMALADEMADQIVGGVGADLLFGITATYLAVARVGQGRIEEGIWDWQVAQQLFPGVAEIDLTVFGLDAAQLAGHSPRQPSSPISADTELPASFEPPRRLDSPVPSFPAGRALRGLKVDVVLQVVVGADGRPREPLVLDSRGEITLVWSALDALSRWRFEPARRDGVAEPALYKLTVSFVVPGD